MSNEKILITGGMGFIGSNFIKLSRQIEPDWEIIVLDKLTYAGNPKNLQSEINNNAIKFIKGDICDSTLISKIIPDVNIIINFAAETHVDRSIHLADEFIQTDIFGTYVLLEATRKCDIHRFVQISTDEVYGDALGKPSREDDPLNPKSPYAASKSGADRLAYSYYCTYEIPIIITRCVNNFGPYQYPEKLIPLFVTNILEKKQLPVYGSGKNTREWIHVDDHSRALISLIKNKNTIGETYNIGTGIELSVLDITEIIIDTIGHGHELIKHVDDRPGHVTRHAVDSSKIRNEIGWNPELTFENAMEKTIEWYIHNEEWWKPIKNGEYLEYYKKQYNI